jgi:hypothetical protein
MNPLSVCQGTKNIDTIKPFIREEDYFMLLFADKRFELSFLLTDIIELTILSDPLRITSEMAK